MKIVGRLPETVPPGTPIRDARGQRIGTVDSVQEQDGALYAEMTLTDEAADAVKVGALRDLSVEPLDRSG